MWKRYVSVRINGFPDKQGGSAIYLTLNFHQRSICVWIMIPYNHCIHPSQWAHPDMKTVRTYEKINEFTCKRFINKGSSLTWLPIDIITLSYPWLFSLIRLATTFKHRQRQTTLKFCIFMLHISQLHTNKSGRAEECSAPVPEVLKMSLATVFQPSPSSSVTMFQGVSLCCLAASREWFRYNVVCSPRRQGPYLRPPLFVFVICLVVASVSVYLH